MHWTPVTFGGKLKDFHFQVYLVSFTKIVETAETVFILYNTDMIYALVL